MGIFFRRVMRNRRVFFYCFAFLHQRRKRINKNGRKTISKRRPKYFCLPQNFLYIWRFHKTWRATAKEYSLSSSDPLLGLKGGPLLHKTGHHLLPLRLLLQILVKVAIVAFPSAVGPVDIHIRLIAEPNRTTKFCLYLQKFKERTTKHYFHFLFCNKKCNTTVRYDTQVGQDQEGKNAQNIGHTHQTFPAMFQKISSLVDIILDIIHPHMDGVLHSITGIRSIKNSRKFKCA